MANDNKLQITKDLPNKKIIVTRHFDASPDLVWRAWTESELLDQWWAPRPWRAETKTMNFTDGGHWLYAMVGPEGEKHWSKVDFKTIVPNRSFEAATYFSDENGNKNEGFPNSSYWKNDFSASEGGTKVVVEIKFVNEADMQQLIAMGFEGGFTMGLNNLEELLEQQLVK